LEGPSTSVRTQQEQPRRTAALYERHDGIGLAEMVKAREVSAGELLEAAMARVEQNNSTINAVVNRPARFATLFPTMIPRWSCA
jgi:hypothetical protein